MQLGASFIERYGDRLKELLAIYLCILSGMLLNEGIGAVGLKMPLFVPCLLIVALITAWMLCVMG